MSIMRKSAKCCSTATDSCLRRSPPTSCISPNSDMRSLRRASTPSWTGCSALDEVQHHRKLAPIHPLPSGGRFSRHWSVIRGAYPADPPNEALCSISCGRSGNVAAEEYQPRDAGHYRNVRQKATSISVWGLGHSLIHMSESPASAMGSAPKSQVRNGLPLEGELP